MKKRLIVIATFVILVIPVVCFALPPQSGPYASGFLGVTFPMTTDITSTQYGPRARNFNDRVEFNPGFLAGGSGGYDFGYIRVEGELSYRYAEMSKITEQISQTTFNHVNGNVGLTALMFNAFFDLRNPSPVTPYIGGGVGFATLHLNETYGTDATTGIRGRLYRSDDETVFAYQVGAGLEIALTKMLSLDIGYRYFGTAKAIFNTETSMSSEMRFEGHNTSIGIRVKF